jgi:hypothetical protein
MRRLVAVIVAVFVGVVGSLAYAGSGSAIKTKITLVQIHADGQFFIAISSVISGSPKCATRLGNFSGNATTAGGKLLLDAAMTAFTEKKTVNLGGAGKCNESGDTESLDMITLE